MSRVAALLVAGCMAAAVAGCAQGGSGVEFIAANSSTVLVDYTRDNAAELETSKLVALEKCGLFGGRARCWRASIPAATGAPAQAISANSGLRQQRPLSAALRSQDRITKPCYVATAGAQIGADRGEARMDLLNATHLIRDEATLTALYGEPLPRRGCQEIDYIHPHYRAMIEASSFVVLATSGPGGLDASPRGDPAGFVHVLDDKTVLIPDRRGNNRADSLRNIIHDPRVALLFLIPGVGETLRINGTAVVSVAPELLARFPFRGTLPRSVIVVTAERVYFQCPKALVRSELWNPEKHVDRKALPSTGTILADVSSGKVGGEQYDREYPERLRTTLY